MKVSINGQEYKYKYSIRALFVFEKIAGKTFCLESTMDFFIFYYNPTARSPYWNRTNLQKY